MKLLPAISKLQQKISTPFLGQPVFRLVLWSLILVSVFPLAILNVRVNEAAWDNTWREVTQKHQVLAQSITTPITLFIDDHRQMLGLLANSISLKNISIDEFTLEHGWLKRALLHMDGFTSLTLLDMDGHMRAIAIESGVNTMPVDESTLASLPIITRTRLDGKAQVSDVMHSPITGKPRLFMSQPVFNQDGVLNGILIGELKLDLIETIRQQIRFGDNGHCMIVDSTGQVVAHPDPLWVREMRNMSHMDIIQRIRTRGMGTMEFQSPYYQTTMIASYANVPSVGWGVIIAQPKQEIVNKVLVQVKSYFIWSAIGLSIAILVAYLLSRWITRPINDLAVAASEIGKRHADTLPELSKIAPREVHQLARIMKDLFDGLRAAGSQIRHLNDSLQQQVESATQELSNANHRLRFQAERDHLTKLSNRRHFESELSKKISSGATRTLCIMLIDIDNFKNINDRYGHAAGDEVLSGLGELLAHLMRPGDLLARYGGDEFVAQMECDVETAEQRAADIRTQVEATCFEWQGNSISTTISIGLFLNETHTTTSLDKLLDTADIAMYRSKKQGRNLVTVIREVA